MKRKQKGEKKNYDFSSIFYDLPVQLGSWEREEKDKKNISVKITCGEEKNGENIGMMCSY